MTTLKMFIKLRYNLVVVVVVAVDWGHRPVNKRGHTFVQRQRAGQSDKETSVKQ